MLFFFYKNLPQSSGVKYMEANTAPKWADPADPAKKKAKFRIWTGIGLIWINNFFHMTEVGV